MVFSMNTIILPFQLLQYTSLQLDSRRTWGIGSAEDVGHSTFEIRAKN